MNASTFRATFVKETRQKETTFLYEKVVSFGIVRFITYFAACLQCL